MRLASDTSCGGGEERYAADLAQVHPHGVVRVGLHRQVEAGRRAGGARRVDPVLQHLDVELGEHLQQALLLLLVEVGRLDDVGDPGDGDGPQLTPLVDELADLLEAR